MWTLIRGIRQLLTLRGPSGPRRGPAAGVLDAIPHCAILLRNGIVERMGKARGVESAREARDAHVLEIGGGLVMPALVEPDALIAPAGIDLPRKKRETETIRGSTERARYGYLAAGVHSADAQDFREVVKILRALQNAQLRPLRLRPVLDLPFPEPGGDNRALMAKVLGKWLPAVQKRRLAAVVEIVIHDGGSPIAEDDAQKLVEAAAGWGFALRFRSIAPLKEPLPHFAVAAGAMAVIAPLDGDGAAAALGGSAVQVVPCAGLLDAAPNGLARIARGRGIALALSSGYSSVEPASLNPQLLLHLAVHRLGMTQEEAITAMTWNAACSLRMSNSAGCIDVGRPADLVAVDVEDYSEMIRRAGSNDLKMTMRGGRVIYSRAGVE